MSSVIPRQKDRYIRNVAGLAVNHEFSVLAVSLLPAQLIVHFKSLFSFPYLLLLILADILILSGPDGRAGLCPSWF